MREKLRLSDLTILYICLSEEWGTNERRCLTDAVYFRNLGGVSFILCLKNSVLDIEASKEDVPRLHFQGELSHWKIWLNFYFQLQQVFLKRQIDLVHNYSFLAIRPLSLILSRMPHIPLVYSFNEKIPSKLKKWYDRLFMTRTDLVFTASNELAELIKESFSLTERKVEVLGAGLEFSLPKLNKTKIISKNKVYFFIPRNAVYDKNTKFIFESITSILHVITVKQLRERFIFTLVTDISWYEHGLYDQLKRIVLERHLEMSIAFETKQLNEQAFCDGVIYVGTSRNEIFVDEDLFALMAKIPMLIPRTASRMSLLKNGDFGETYQAQDVRELRSKFFKMIECLDFYKMNFSISNYDLLENQDIEIYLSLLHGLYERLCNRRIRFAEKRE
jgi:hypothetical protein